MALDKGAASNERDVALREALHMVEMARALPVDAREWRKTVMMRFCLCARCTEKISPLQRVYRRGEEFLHEACFNGDA